MTQEIESSPDQKHCTGCGTVKPRAEFHMNRRQQGGLQVECRTCQAARNAAWYEANRDRKLAACARRRDENKARLVAVKLALSCADCGWKPSNEDEVRRLDFDHEDPETKHRGTSETGAFNIGWSWGRIEAELKLCVARCRPCHMARTTREGHRQRRHQKPVATRTTHPDDPEVNR